MNEIDNVLTEIKEEVSKQTGVPSALLSGNSYQEIADSAKTLIEYKKEYRAQFDKTPKAEPTTADQFGDWLSKAHPSHTFLPSNGDQEAPASVEAEPVRTYPVIHDGGEAHFPHIKESTAKLFEEWFNGSLGGCHW